MHSKILKAMVWRRSAAAPLAAAGRYLFRTPAGRAEGRLDRPRRPVAGDPKSENLTSWRVHRRRQRHQPDVRCHLHVLQPLRIELSLRIPSPHGIDVKPEGGPDERIARNRSPAADPEPRVASVRRQGDVQPYVGRRMNYTMFFNEQLRNNPEQRRPQARRLVRRRLRDRHHIALARTRMVPQRRRALDGHRLPTPPSKVTTVMSSLAPSRSTRSCTRWASAVASAPRCRLRRGCPPRRRAPPAPAKCSDADNDGVATEATKCPGTPAGVKVDKVGCPLGADAEAAVRLRQRRAAPRVDQRARAVVKFSGRRAFATALIEGHTDSKAAMPTT